MKTIDRISSVTGRVLDFSLQAINKGKDAVGEVSMRVSYGDDIVSGKGSSTDIVRASAKAYLNCLNRSLFSRDHKATPKRKTSKKKAAAKKKPTRKKVTRKKTIRKKR